MLARFSETDPDYLWKVDNLVAVVVVTGDQCPRNSGDWVAIQMLHRAFLASYAFYGDLHNPMQFVYLQQYQVVA